MSNPLVKINFSWFGGTLTINSMKMFLFKLLSSFLKIKLSFSINFELNNSNEFQTNYKLEAKPYDGLAPIDLKVWWCLRILESWILFCTAYKISVFQHYVTQEVNSNCRYSWIKYTISFSPSFWMDDIWWQVLTHSTNDGSVSI